jgi:hypothetical protein
MLINMNDYPNLLVGAPILPPGVYERGYVTSIPLGLRYWYAPPRSNSYCSDYGGIGTSQMVSRGYGP